MKPGRRQRGGKGLESKGDYKVSLGLSLAYTCAHYHITLHNRLNRSNALILRTRNETPVVRVVALNTHKNRKKSKRSSHLYINLLLEYFSADTIAYDTSSGSPLRDKQLQTTDTCSPRIPSPRRPSGGIILL